MTEQDQGMLSDQEHYGDPVKQVKLTLEQENDAASNLLKAEQERKNVHIAATVACIAAAARLQALTLKKYPAPGELSEFTAEDSFEYARLKGWWDAFPLDKQMRVALNIKELAANVELLAEKY